MPAESPLTSCCFLPGLANGCPVTVQEPMLVCRCCVLLRTLSTVLLSASLRVDMSSLFMCRTLTPFGFQAEERTLWEATDTYINMSPYLQAHKIKKPLLLIHGEDDNNTGTCLLLNIFACCGCKMRVLLCTNSQSSTFFWYVIGCVPSRLFLGNDWLKHGSIDKGIGAEQVPSQCRANAFMLR